MNRRALLFAGLAVAPARAVPADIRLVSNQTGVSKWASTLDDLRKLLG